MAAKHHPPPLSGGDRKVLQKELVKARAMTGILDENLLPVEFQLRSSAVMS
jgi:hypothetical protein